MVMLQLNVARRIAKEEFERAVALANDAEVTLALIGTTQEAEGVKVEDVHLAFGNPDEASVKLGEELEVGLIVMGSRGLGGVRRALMGSVSASVIASRGQPTQMPRNHNV
jgi:nucleotide-binding universal stress UspA family protein